MEMTEYDDPHALGHFKEHTNSGCWVDAVSTIKQYLSYFRTSLAELMRTDVCINNIVTSKPCHLLLAAVDCDSADVVDLLINNGCDVDAGTFKPFRSYQESPLYRAVQRGNAHIVQTLLEAGCDRNALNNTGNTALYEAVFEGQIQIVDLLLKNGSDPNIPDCYGKTSLHVLPFSNSDRWMKQKCIQMMIESGADLSMRCPSGQTPVDLAIQYKFTLTIKYLMNNAQALGVKRIPHSFSKDVEGIPEIDFHADARRFYQLMVLSGVADLPTRTVLSLQESSRVTIRRHLGEQCWYLSPHLPIPVGIQDYLQLRDVIHEQLQDS